MGMHVIAECACGFGASSYIGGGMLNFQTTCLFPCLCECCHDMVQVNVLHEPMLCPHCGGAVIPYNDPTLSEGAGTGPVAYWNISEGPGRELILTDAHYRCPRCAEMTLRFRNSGRLRD